MRRLTLSCVAVLPVVLGGLLPAAPTVDQAPVSPGQSANELAFEDPLYLDPSYYNAYYGYWTDNDARELETVV